MVIPLEPFDHPFTERIDFESIVASINSIPLECRGEIAEYLRSSPMIVAIMEYTTDKVGDRFGVPGGSSIVSDRVYYWRLDTADYVEVYGISLSDDFLKFGASRRWIPPVIDAETEAALDQEIMSRFQR